MNNIMTDADCDLAPFGDFYLEIYPKTKGFCLRRKNDGSKPGPMLLDMSTGIVPIGKLDNKKALR